MGGKGQSVARAKTRSEKRQRADNARATAAAQPAAPPDARGSSVGRTTPGRKPHALHFFSAAFLIFCAVTAAMAVPFFWRQYAVLKHWPEVAAQVVRGNVAQVNYGGTTYYALDLQLVFTHDGRTTFGSASPRQSRQYEKVRRTVDEYPVGSYHTVRFNPERPAEIRLHAGWNRRFFVIPILLGCAAALFGAISAILAAVAHAQGK